MLHHIGPLGQKLVQNSHAVYEHVDCPPVGYPEITNEMFCHRYYLRNLCNTDRFHDWPILDHVPLLQVGFCGWSFKGSDTEQLCVHHPRDA